MDYFFKKGKFTEDQLEQAIIELFQLQGYSYVHGENIHRQYEDILLEDDLRSYLLSRYSDLSPVEVQKVINKIALIQATPLYLGNKETFRLVNEGIDLQRDDISKIALHVEYISRQLYMQENDFTVSVDQNESLYQSIAYNGLEFPKIDSNGRYDKDELKRFIWRIAKIFKWKEYESYTLGYPADDKNNYTMLTWYVVILGQWVSGRGLQQIIEAAIWHKKNNPTRAMFIDGERVDYRDCAEHNNIIISDVLSVIDKIILFKLSNYFLKISKAYKKIKGTAPTDDWYEFVEYGSTNKRSIDIQKHGFSRESALYILRHEADYIDKSGPEIKLKKSLLACQNKGVMADAELARYNTPELFV